MFKWLKNIVKMNEPVDEVNFRFKIKTRFNSMADEFFKKKYINKENFKSMLGHDLWQEFLKAPENNLLLTPLYDDIKLNYNYYKIIEQEYVKRANN